MEKAFKTKLRWVAHGLRLAMIRDITEVGEENYVTDVVNTVSRWILIGMVYAMAALAGAGIAAWQIGAIV